MWAHKTKQKYFISCDAIYVKCPTLTHPYTLVHMRAQTHKCIHTHTHTVEKTLLSRKQKFMPACLEQINKNMSDITR